MPILFALFFLTLSSQATLHPEEVLATSTISHRVSNGWFRRDTELCMLPVHLSNANYSAKDAQNERELCSYNIDKNIAACPKTNSTNPGVNFVLPPAGMNLKDLTRQECEVEGAKKVAKYKLSISCSYSPGILAYYHVSRALGNIVNVPTSVLRTMNLKRHQELAKRALNLLSAKPDEQITKWWNLLSEDLDNRNSSERADFLFAENFDQTYGALSDNPTGEERYAEFNNKSEDREMEFKLRNPIYAALINPSTHIARTFSQENVQKMRQLKDAGDFLLLDTLLNQQDRFGNIHFKLRYYYKNGSALVRANKLEEVPEGSRAGVLAVKEMMLKDNDCSIVKSARIKRAQLLDSVAHLDPRTYSSFMSFANSFETSATHDFFIRGLQFRESDYRSVANNIRDTARLLKTRCQNGALALDLDLERHFSDGSLPQSYNCGN